MAEPIRIEGLREFTRRIKKMDSDLPKAVRIALNEGAQLVLDDARPKVPKRTGRAQRSMRVASTRTLVRVRAGGAKAPYYPWLDFGGRVGPGRSIVRKFWSDGRYLYRSYYDLSKQDKLQEVLAKALTDVARQAGIEVT